MQEEITVAQACQISGLSHSYVIRLVKEGKIKGRQIGQFWVVQRSSLQAYLDTPRKSGPKGPIKYRQQEEAPKELMPLAS